MLPLKQSIKAIEQGLATEETLSSASAGLDHGYAYRWSLLSYFDVLGMREILANDDPNQIARVLKIARKFSAPDEEVAKCYGGKFANFSDLIVRAVQIKTDLDEMDSIGLVFQELFDLAGIQVNLIAKGVLVRGAVTIGPISIQDGLIFGPALANAYLLESETAVFPRIIVEDLVLEALEKIPLLRAHDFEYEWAEVRKLIRHDFDGMWFVDYLGYLFENADDLEQHVQVMSGHKTTIQKLLEGATLLPAGSRERQGRIAKAFWLRDYHNQHVQQMNESMLLKEMGVGYKELLV